MDSLTHIVLGACIGEALLGRKIGKKAMLWGALANSFPDMDVVLTPFYHPADALLAHRGITHSFFFLGICAPLFAWGFQKWYKTGAASFKDWALFFLIAFLAHPLLDSFSMYGTGIFEPFSNYRFQFTTLFIIDPAFTLPLLLSFLALLSIKQDSAKRRSWVMFGLISGLLYLSLTVCNKLYVGKIFSDSMHKQNIHYTGYGTAPTPLNTILWNVVAKDTNGLWVGYYSHLDKTRDIKFSFIPYNDSLAGDLIDNHVTQQLLLFSEGYYCFTREGEDLYVNDLRFGFSGEFDEKGNRFVFSFGLKKDDSAPYGVQIKQNSWSRSRFEGFSKLIERVQGI